MFLNRKNLDQEFQHYVGTSLDIDDIRKHAAIRKIRLCVIFNNNSNGTPETTNSGSYHYQQKFTNLDLELRTSYLKRKIPKELYNFYDRLQQIGEEFAEKTSSMTEEDGLALIASKANITMEKMESLLNKMQNVLQQELADAEKIINRGYLLPLENLKYKATGRVNLPDLSQEKYRGNRLIIHTDDNTITSIKVEKYRP